MDNSTPHEKAEQQDKMRRAEDVLDELHQLAGSVAAVFDSRDPEDEATLDHFDRVIDALEGKVD